MDEESSLSQSICERLLHRHRRPRPTLLGSRNLRKLCLLQQHKYHLRENSSARTSISVSERPCCCVFRPSTHVPPTPYSQVDTNNDLTTSDPWWIYTTCNIFWVIKSQYDFSLIELVRESPRFGIMLLSMCISIAFIVVDILSVLHVFREALPTGINPFWKVSSHKTRRWKPLQSYT